MAAGSRGVRLASTYADSGLRVIGVNGRDQELTTKHVQRFVNAFHVAFPIALDQRGKTRREFRLVGLPTTVFIDSAGVVQLVHMGPISREDLDHGVSLISPAH